jgi:Uma2 family endonuclease
MPADKLWTVTEFHQLGEHGFLEGKRAKLIDGRIVVEGPMNPPHALSMELSMEALRKVFDTQWRFRIQLPLPVGVETDPQPDIAIIRGSARGATSHPTTADLIVEISDSSLKFDTTEKMSLYASAGIADYWVVDVNDRVVLVHRQPVIDAESKYGLKYGTVQKYYSGSTIAPLAVSKAAIPVAEMLP